MIPVFVVPNYATRRSLRSHGDMGPWGSRYQVNLGGRGFDSRLLHQPNGPATVRLFFLYFRRSDDLQAS